MEQEKLRWLISWPGNVIPWGKKTAVISRGYGRKEIKRLRVVCHGSGPLLTPELAGDEPYLIARRNPFLIVIVSVDRKKGVAKAVKEFGAEVIILDDGFQNFGVRRDLDIVLLDAENPLGNGQLLPAGPLREFPSALSRGQLFVFTRAERPRSPAMDLPGEYLFCRHTLGSVVHSLAGEQISMADLKNRKGAAFAGVCNTERFFSDLAGKHLNIVETLAFSDHCMYGPEEIHRLNELAINADYLITTEKDAVKLRGEDLAKKCYAVPLSLQFFDDDKLKKLIMGMLE